MRKLLLVTLLLVSGALVVRRLRPRSAAAPRPVPATPVPTPQRSEPEPPPMRPPVPGPPPPTTNGERVLLLSISSLEGRGDDPTTEAVVAHVAAGEIDPDERTVEVLLQRMAGSGLLTGGNGAGPYGLTETGQAALSDGAPARPSPAGDAADELSAGDHRLTGPPARWPGGAGGGRTTVTGMAVFSAAFPILPGKAEQARRFAEEVMGPRRGDFDKSQARFGSTRETWALQSTPDGDLMLVWFEAPDIEKGFAVLAESTEAFDVWFRGQVQETTGFDLAAPQEDPPPEVLVDWTP